MEQAWNVSDVGSNAFRLTKTIQKTENAPTHWKTNTLTLMKIIKIYDFTLTK